MTRSYQPNPSAKPISDAIVLEPPNPRLVDSLSIIDSVHRDGKLYQINVRVTDSLPLKYKDYEGIININHENIVTKILIRQDYPDWEIVAIHEISHFIDWVIFGNSNAFGSTGLVPDLQEWWEAVIGSRAYQQLEYHRAAGYQNEYGQRVSKETTDKIIDYYLKPEELFARSYTQYILTKSTRPPAQQLLATLLDNSELKRYSQWCTEDFSRISAAFDNLFINKGWVI